MRSSDTYQASDNILRTQNLTGILDLYSFILLFKLNINLKTRSLSDPMKIANI